LLFVVQDDPATQEVQACAAYVTMMQNVLQEAQQALKSEEDHVKASRKAREEKQEAVKRFSKCRAGVPACAMGCLVGALPSIWSRAPFPALV
jgi:hypothetical protein